MSERSFGEGPALMVYQKSEASNRPTDCNERLPVKLSGQTVVVGSAAALSAAGMTEGLGAGEVRKERSAVFVCFVLNYYFF